MSNKKSSKKASEKKKTTKKSSAKKKTIKKKSSKKKTPTKRTVIKNAPVQNYFVLCNGKPLKNIKELADVMDNLEEQVFNHHVREESNDFSSWVNDVFKEAELAKKLAGAKDKKNIQLVIYKHITNKFCE